MKTFGQFRENISDVILGKLIKLQDKKITSDYKKVTGTSDKGLPDPMKPSPGNQIKGI